MVFKKKKWEYLLKIMFIYTENGTGSIKKIKTTPTNTKHTQHTN